MIDLQNRTDEVVFDTWEATKFDSIETEVYGTWYPE